MTDRAVDTSVLVAALASWHPHHEVARRAVREAGCAPAHVLTETYSVLTRLPAPHRITAATAGAAVGALDLRWLSLPTRRLAALVRTLAAAGVAGGAVYDGVVAATAVHHDRELVTLDHRARRTYELVGVRHRLLG